MVVVGRVTALEVAGADDGEGEDICRRHRGWTVALLLVRTFPGKADVVVIVYLAHIIILRVDAVCAAVAFKREGSGVSLQLIHSAENTATYRIGLLPDRCYLPILVRRRQRPGSLP